MKRMNISWGNVDYVTKMCKLKQLTTHKNVNNSKNVRFKGGVEGKRSF